MSRLTDDRGDSLVEILVALAVLGIGVVALTGALATNISTTVTNREQSQAESLLASAAEYMKTASVSFSCPSPTTTTVLTSAQVPRDTSVFTLAFGSGQPVEGQPCSKIVSIPVTVTGDGYDLSVNVVRRQ